MFNSQKGYGTITFWVRGTRPRNKIFLSSMHVTMINLIWIVDTKYDPLNKTHPPSFIVNIYSKLSWSSFKSIGIKGFLKLNTIIAFQNNGYSKIIPLSSLSINMLLSDVGQFKYFTLRLFFSINYEEVWRKKKITKMQNWLR